MSNICGECNRCYTCEACVARADFEPPTKRADESEADYRYRCVAALLETRVPVSDGWPSIEEWPEDEPEEAAE